MRKLAHNPRFYAYLVILLALALRLGYWQAHMYDPLKMVGDEGGNYGAAVSLVRGTTDWWFSDNWLRWLGIWLRPPLYPLSLVGPVALLGEGLTAVRLFQVLPGVLTVLVLYRLGRELFGAWVGVLTGLLSALYSPLISQPVQLMPENLFILLLVLSFLLIIQFYKTGSRKRLFAAGVVLALTALSRTVVTFFIPVVALWLLLEPGSSRKRILTNIGLLIAGVAVVIGPWTMRNYGLYHRILLTDTNGAASMIDGNPELRNRINLDPSVNPVDLQSQVVSEYIKDRLNHPFDALEAFAPNALHLLRPNVLYEASNFDFRQTWPELVRDFLLDDFIFICTLIFGIIGLVGARDWRASLLFAGWTVYNVLILTVLYFSAIRYRLPVLVMLMPYAAFGIMRIRQALLTRARPVQFVAVGLCLVVLVAAFGNYPARFAQLLAAGQDLGRAELAERSGDATGVKRAIDEAAAVDPNDGAIWIAAGDITRRMGQTADALRYYQLAQKRLPGSDSVRLRLGDLLRATGQVEQAQGVLNPEGSDDSLFLNWAWDHPELLSDRPSRVLLGNADAGYVRWTYFAGLVDTDQANWTMRWTQRVTQIRLYAPPGHARVLTLFLAGARPQDVPRPQLEVFVNGRQVAKLVVRRVWDMVNISLPNDLPTANEYIVTLRTDQWKPGGSDLTLPDIEMPDLGIQVGGAQIGDEPLTMDSLSK